MRETSKRWIGLLLAVIMIVSMVPTAVTALADTYTSNVIGPIQLEKTLVASDGNTYRITLTYDRDKAGIPENAELQVTEILQEVTEDPEATSAYDEYLSAAESALEKNQRVTFARFFDITIVSDGQEIQPAVPVEVKIELADEELDAEKTEEVKAVHFSDNGEVTSLDTTLEDQTVTFHAEGFSVYGIVGMEVITAKYITADGETYTITVTYGPEAKIPEGVELKAKEILEGSEEYEYYFEQTLQTLNEKVNDEEYLTGIDFARFFDVTIYNLEGEKIEPQAPVEVRITYDDPVSLAEDTSLKVVHFAEDKTEIIDIETEEDSVKEIIYEQNGFSVIGTVAETNAYGWPTVANTPYVMLLQDGEDYYAVAHDGTLRKVYYLNGTVAFMGQGTTELDYLDDYLWNYSVVSSTRHTARLSTYGTDPVNYIDPYYGVLNPEAPDSVIGSAQRTLYISNGKIYATYYGTQYSLSAEDGTLHRTTLNSEDASPIYFANYESFTADSSESEIYDFININVLIDKWKNEMTQDLVVDKTAEVYDYENRIYQVDLMASSGYHIISPALALEFVVDASRSMFFPENLHRVQVNGSDYTYSNMQGLRYFFTRLDASQRDTVFYVITDKNNAATNWAVFYHDADKLTVYKDGGPMASGWYYIDASYFYPPDDYERRYPYTGGWCYPLDTSTLNSLNDGYIYTADEKVEGQPWSRLEYMQISVEAAARVLYAVDPDAQIGLVTFNKNTFSYGPFTANQENNLIHALYNVSLDGGTRHADGLKKAISEFNSSFQNVNNCQTAVVLITDGAPNGNTWEEIQTAATNVKAMENAYGQNTRLFTLGLSLENVGTSKAELANISTEPHSDFAFSAEKSTEVVHFITKIIEGLTIDANLIGNVTDVIDAGFYPVNPETGMPLVSGTWITEDGAVTTPGAEDAAGQVNNVDGVWKVEWKNCGIDWPTYTDSTKTEIRDHGWNGRVYVKAQEDFLGGNDIPTNGTGSRVEAIQYINPRTHESVNISGDEAEKTKAFDTPYVNVDELLFDENSTEWTVYLGESVDPKKQIQSLLDAVKVYEVVKDNGSLVYTLSPASVENLSGDNKNKTGKTFSLSTLIGELTEADWNKLINGESIEIDYEAYGHTPGVITLSLTQQTAPGEDDLTPSPHATAVTGNDVEKYEFTISYEPFDPSVVDYHTGNKGTGSHGENTDDIVSDNVHEINVFAKGLHITKTNEGFEKVLTGAKFVLYRTARSTDDTTKVKVLTGLEGSWYPVATLDCSSGGTASLSTVEKLKDGENYYLIETEVPAGYYGIGPIPVEISTTDYYIQPAGSDNPADKSTTKPSSGLYDWEQTATLLLNSDSGIKRTSDPTNTTDLTHIEIIASSDNETMYYRIANTTGVVLPNTGGS
ncbi:MAG: VWA domain-containing protein, partial [Oscillospiraceae bacterium]|nr:VWA domain-containing protein [Oscillospiraceae bacterium]